MKTFAACILFFLLTGKAFAQGGPPLVTDDPGTPGNGNWEINSVLQWSGSDENKVLQFPLFDINYGYSDHIQLNLNTALITVDQTGENRTSGLSVASVGVKWRFVDEETSGISISTFPRYDFHHGLSSDNPAINPPGRRYFLPFEFSKEFGRIGVNPEVGYATFEESGSEWVYGIAFSYSFEKEREALFEVHGRSRVGSSEQELLYNFGLRYLIAEKVSFIGTLGKTIITLDDAPTTWNIYAGLQIRL